MPTNSSNIRLKEFLKHKCISGTGLAELLGTSQPTISAILSGRRNLSEGMIARISRVFPELNISWLHTGEGDMLKPETTAHEIGAAIAVGSRDDVVSLVDYVPVTAHATFIENLIEPSSNQFEKIPVILRESEREEIDKYKIFEVDGDSMAPAIYDGAIVLAKEIPESRWHYAEGTVVVSFAEYVVIKRIKANRLLTDNSLVLSSDNEKYGQMTVQLSDIRAIYKAKRIISSDIK